MTWTILLRHLARGGMTQASCHEIFGGLPLSPWTEDLTQSLRIAMEAPPAPCILRTPKRIPSSSVSRKYLRYRRLIPLTLVFDNCRRANLAGKETKIVDLHAAAFEWIVRGGPALLVPHSFSKMQSSPLTFPPIEKHGVIGDRRTAALVAADGTIDWCCFADFDGPPLFGSLLDPDRGGFCRFGPSEAELGEQQYEEHSACLITRWKTGGAEIELCDFMTKPGRDRAAEAVDSRVILRRLRAVGGKARIHFSLRPRLGCDEAPRVVSCESGVRFQFSAQEIVLWTSFDVRSDDRGTWSDLTLPEGEELWAMVGLNEDPLKWSISRCWTAHAETNAYWRTWVGGLGGCGRDDPKLQRCAMTVHLLAHAPQNAVVAAITTSLPERIGGDRNYDYRYAWVRDASMSAAFLAITSDSREVARYFDWLCGLDSIVPAPLQVCYHIDGRTRLDTHKLERVAGYRGSQPVRIGNRAYRQHQLGSLGWFADSALIYVEAGGEWKPQYGKMLDRAAKHICAAWREKDSGVWELAVEAHYVASKLMAWVTLDRALRIARRTDNHASDEWCEVREVIRHEILTKGWSDKCNSFRQRYDAEALDAASLLVSLMGFLPPDDPHVLGTLDAIERELVIDGLVHRFDPTATLGGKQLPIGEFEGAFLPATFWYAHALAGAGRTEQAKQILTRCEEIAGGLGLFAEEADARRKCFLGNTPLLFSQVEYGRALLALRKQTAKTASGSARPPSQSPKTPAPHSR